MRVEAEENEKTNFAPSLKRALSVAEKARSGKKARERVRVHQGCKQSVNRQKSARPEGELTTSRPRSGKRRSEKSDSRKIN